MIVEVENKHVTDEIMQIEPVSKSCENLSIQNPDRSFKNKTLIIDSKT